jgi:hypothetical protein
MKSAVQTPESDMKTTSILTALLLHSLTVDGWSQAGAANVIKQRARETAGRPAAPKNGASGVRAPVRAPAGAATPAPSRVRSPQQLIETDLSLIRIKRGVIDELRDRLASHIIEAAGEGATLDREAVGKLAADLAATVQQHKAAIGFEERKKLAEALVKGVSPEPATKSFDEVNAALRKAGLPAEVVDPLVEGLRAIPARRGR